MDKIETKILPPFKRFCMTIGQLPSSYLESMSYAECIVWLCNYLKETVIPAVNENAEAVNDLINWFNTLDVQDEINNKLDDMAESGELEEIMAAYLNTRAIFGFDTVADMKLAENLINGSFAKTLGFYTKNDGGMSTYKIRTITNDDVVDEKTIIALNDDSLIAELIVEDVINLRQLGAKLNGIDDDSSILTTALSLANKIVLPKSVSILLNEVEIPSYKEIDFNKAIIKTNSVAIKESDLTETTGYNYRKNITIKNAKFELSENTKGLSLCNTIESTIENIIVESPLPENAIVIYYTNCFNLTFKDIFINGNDTNSYETGTCGIYGTISSGGIAGTNNITNMMFENILIQRVQNGITFNIESGVSGSYDTILAKNIGFSWCDKALNITDNVTHSTFSGCVETMRAEHSNYGLYNNGGLSLINLKCYNDANGIYNKGRMVCNGKIEITGTVSGYAIYNSGNLDLSNSLLYTSETYSYSLGTNIENAPSFNYISNSSTSLSWIDSHPEPINYNLTFTGTNLYYEAFKTPTTNNLHVNVKCSNTTTLYIHTGQTYVINAWDTLVLHYVNGSWFIETSANFIQA